MLLWLVLDIRKAAAMIGPTLLELGCVTNRPLNIMSWVFFSQALSALFGSSLGGFLADRYDCNITLLYCVTSVAIYLAIIPVCHVFGVMLAFFALLGVHMGVIDTVANSVLIKIHGKKVAPRLQSLHFFYGLGALVSLSSRNLSSERVHRRAFPEQHLWLVA
ncbi:glucose transmembrane transporter [Desmophyllum pertusum]|uniref:Glucose transmembrane transporter n=1 Tax=Desmophyllum pertusum TaxID=174260 RepID=A0A9X0CY31_9CNID|nr:glucose transmembrane transporter [Desmophyllum pertusum]